MGNKVKDLQLNTTSLSSSYETVLYWAIKEMTRDGDVSIRVMLSVLKIINDLVIYNLQAEQCSSENLDQATLKAERIKIIDAKPEFALFVSIHGALRGKIPDPAFKEIVRKYHLIRRGLCVLGFCLFPLGIFLPPVLMLPWIMLATGIFAVPGAVMLCEQRRNHIDVRSFDKSTKVLVAAGVIGFGFIAVVSVFPVHTLILLSPFAFFLAVVSLSMLIASYIRQPIYDYQTETLKNLPSLNTQLTEIIAPTPDKQAPGLKDQIDAVLLTFMGLREYERTSSSRPSIHYVYCNVIDMNRDRNKAEQNKTTLNERKMRYLVS